MSGKSKPLTEEQKMKKREYDARRYQENKDRILAQNAAYYQENKDHIAARMAAYYEIAFREGVFHYSNGTNCCAECGETRGLQFDHVNGDPREFNKSLGISPNWGGGKLAAALRALGYPGDIQILCANCNLIKGKAERKKTSTEQKLCSKCGIIRSIDEFHKDKSKRDGLRWRCVYCVADYKLNKKIKAYNKLGLDPVCACCGYNKNMRALGIEHIYGDGIEHSHYLAKKYNLNLNYVRGMGRGRISSETFLKYYILDLESGAPKWPGIIVLCSRCNSSRHFYGYCCDEHDRYPKVAPIGAYDAFIL